MQIGHSVNKKVHHIDDEEEEIPIFEEARKAPYKGGTLEDPGIVGFWKDYENRILRLEFPCVRDYLVEITKIILRFNREDDENNIPAEERKPIKLFIQSEGGALEDTLSFIDIVSLSKTPIWTYNMGYAWSGGFILLLVGEKRFCLKNSTALLHQGSATSGGEQTFGQVQEDAKNYAKRISVMENYVLERTKIPKQLYSRKRRTEWYMDAEEQVKYGVVDKIIEDITELY